MYGIIQLEPITDLASAVYYTCIDAPQVFTFRTAVVDPYKFSRGGALLFGVYQIFTKRPTVFLVNRFNFDFS